ncbi:TerD family protein [Bacillus licheniformis]|nr:TerD family protein [Bacillus licheniformis]
MAISLAKDKNRFNKTNPGLSKVVVGLGWDVNQYDGGADLTWMLACSCSTQKASALLKGLYFYNQTEGAGGAVIHTGDNRTGEGEGDDEQVKSI